MDKIVNFVIRAVGLGKAVDALNGETSKTYQGAAILILTGAATLLGGIAGVVGQIAAAATGADYLALAQGLAHNSSAGLIMAGAGTIGKGIAIIGQRHALAKAVASEPVVAPVETPKI
jgi:hypothetical protein